jgi:hypothetical protein
MRIPRSKLLLSGLLFSSILVAQEVSDDSGTRFFQMLKAVFHSTERPITFDEAVATSSVIASGNLIKVIPGRSIGSSAAPGMPPMNTVLLKIRPSRVLKGDREEYYLLETPASNLMVSELNETLYTGDLVFLLRPASERFISPEISIWPEAQAELSHDKPLYQLTRRALLFTPGASGRLEAPLDYHREFSDIHANIGSIAELEAHIIDIQSRAQQ